MEREIQERIDKVEGLLDKQQDALDKYTALLGEAVKHAKRIDRGYDVRTSVILRLDILILALER